MCKFINLSCARDMVSPSLIKTVNTKSETNNPSDILYFFPLFWFIHKFTYIYLPIITLRRQQPSFQLSGLLGKPQIFPDLIRSFIPSSPQCMDPSLCILFHMWTAKSCLVLTVCILVWYPLGIYCFISSHDSNFEFLLCSDT